MLILRAKEVEVVVELFQYLMSSIEFDSALNVPVQILFVLESKEIVMEAVQKNLSHLLDYLLSYKNEGSWWFSIDVECVVNDVQQRMTVDYAEEQICGDVELWRDDLLCGHGGICYRVAFSVLNETHELLEYVDAIHDAFAVRHEKIEGLISFAWQKVI